MRALVLFAALLWLQGLWAEEDACPSLEGSPDGEGGGPPLSVNVSSQGKPTSLFLSWPSVEPGGLGYALSLRSLNPLGSPEGQQLWAHTNESSFEFHGLVPGSHYQLDLTVLRPCGQNVTVNFTVQTAPSVVHGLQLHSSGSPAILEAAWSDAPGNQDGYQLLLYHLESQTLACNVSVSPSILSYNFSNLLPGSQYVLEVITWAGSLQAKTSIHQWTEPVPPNHIELRALDTSSLQAFWNSSEGAAWFHLMLTDLLGDTNLTAVVKRGVSNHTFLHLSPGTPYKLKLCAVAGPHWVVGPDATEWTYPSNPSDLVLTPLPSELWASWKAGLGARDSYVLKLSGPVENSTTLGPEECNAVFPGPLPPGHYTLGLKVLAGPYQAWMETSTWLAEPAVLPKESPGARLWLHGLLEASKQSGRWALLYADGAPDLLGNVSVPLGATDVTFCGLVPGAHYRVDIASSVGDITQSIAGYTRPLPPQSLEVVNRSSPSDLTIHWIPAPGQQEGYTFTWHQDGGQRSPGNIVALGPDNSSLTLKSLVPGSCYTVSAWAWAGNLSSSLQKIHSCTRPAPPTNVSLGFSTQPGALRASWSHPPGGRDGFHLRLYRLRPLALESEKILSRGARNFSWAQLDAGSEFQVQLATLWGSEESSSANVTGWTPPLAPTLVNVTSEAPTQLQVFWVHAPGGRHSYQVSLYQEGARTTTSVMGPMADRTTFLGLAPGTKYKVEVISWAGPLYTAATNVSAWTYPLTPSELLVSMQAGSAVVNLAWPSGPLGQGTCHAQLSDAGRLSWEQPLSPGQDHLVLRRLTPGRTVLMSVKCQAGSLQASTHPVALSVEPGPVEDVLCQPEATHLVLNWTMPAGDVDACLVVAEQLVGGEDAHFVFQVNTSEDALLLPNLMPATSYRLSLTVLGRNDLWSRAVTLVCCTSTEVWHPPELVEAPQLELGTGMGVTVTRGMFGKDDGQIQWYGIIVTTNLSLTQPSREAINHTWYDHYYGGRDSYLAVLFPNPFYPGPWAVPRSWTVPVGTDNCGHTQEICNGRLKPGFQYRFSIAAFSRLNLPETIVAFSAFSEPQASISLVAVPLTVMMGTVVGCVSVVCAVLCLLGWWCLKGPRPEKDGFSHELMPYNLRRTHRPIPIHSFRQSYEVKSAHAHQAFFQEFEELKEVGREQPRLEAEHPDNTSKNRYPHVLPYDHSRVRLSQLAGEPHSDYINANFIPGYSHPQEFIATQGPLKKTVEDFWRLVWEQQVHIIIMLTVGMENGRVLCEHYWPANSTPVTHGHITIHLLAEESEEEWTRREFQLQHAVQQKQRRVKQLQFTTWPDHGVPEAPSSLLTFAELVREQVQVVQGKGPTLVHCSAGVGRTGTFVALLRLLQQLEEEQVVDVFNTVYMFRLHRPLMIQTPGQYIFLHSCLLNKILEGPSDTADSGPISVMNFAQACAKRAANANAGFLKEYKLLRQAIKYETGSLMPPPGYNENSIVPGDPSQTQFSLVEESPADRTLEAWLFPGGPSGRDHVVLTGPARPKELWELVWKHGAHVLVSLGLPDTKEKPQDFWPTEMQPVVSNMVTVHRVAESNTAGWPCTLFRVIHGESGMERQVQRLQFPCWESGCELPATTLLPFLDAVSQCCSRGKSKKPGTLLTHSSKGTNQLGTFLAMEQLLQQAGTEYTVDVFSVALKQSQACGLMTPTLEQYIYLYNCLNSALLDGLP
ncbi:receptor-type tyrosine-protein phosphatase V [Phodopus roborovskii]|uniref:Receptor-type tyrosine-protein phosphatase V n=1 Tax=Phodopus roborovskii TaxID=109678 RepID=A0AAV0A2U4_PHORO|nr:receptor-type tyrosine-protein phosphatase V [Phodopus roborovskii]CAH7206401.1 Ptprv [Phodopus roborovskii]